MKNIFLFFSLVFLIACSKDDGSFSNYEDNVVSDTKSIDFEKLLLLLNVKTTDDKYLVIESVDSVDLYVNDLHWSRANSNTLDITHIEKTEQGNAYLADQKVNYLLVAGKDIGDAPPVSTAGAYASYLNSLTTLLPGEYACFIASFRLKLNDGTIRKYYPNRYVIFKVEENIHSAFVGEIELQITL